MNNSVINLIINKYGTLSKTEKIIGDYIINNIESVLDMTITDLSDTLDLGQASIFRFCKTLDFKGYQDFKMNLALNQNINISNTIETKNNNNVSKEIFDIYNNSIIGAYNTIDMVKINKVVEKIITCRTINVFGFASSGTTANEFNNKFIRIMSHIIYNSDSHLQLNQASLLSKDDLSIIFTNSGVTKDCIYISELSKERGAFTVIVTQNEKSPCAKYSDTVLYCGYKEGPFEGGSIGSKLSQLFLIDVLYEETYRRLGSETIENKKITSKSVSHKML